MIVANCDLCGRKATQSRRDRLSNDFVEAEFSSMYDVETFELCGKCAGDLVSFLRGKIQTLTREEAADAAPPISE